MFTTKEAVLFWLPALVVLALVVTAMVVADYIDLPVGVLIVVIAGVLLRIAATRINPAPAVTEETEVTE